VPETLLSGNHEQIRQWRTQAAMEKTARLRPDLTEAATADFKYDRKN
jgi:tRNA (guanine-N1)-methyltransferase